MGNTFEVNAWRRDERGKFGNLCIYRGESFVAALCTMFGSRKAYGCLTLEWRPRSRPTVSATQESK